MAVAEEDISNTVKDYVFDLHQATRAKLTKEQSEVNDLYGAKFAELSKTFYSDAAWPAAESIASDVGDDKLFLCFYREMTYRQQSSKSFGNKASSSQLWQNYCALFDILLAGEDTDMMINERWAFDIVKEFVYNFQTSCQHRMDLLRRTSEEIEVLKANPDMWNLATVSKYLRGLVKVSNVEAILAAQRAAGQPSDKLDLANDKSLPPAPSKMHFDLGYFALFGLSRLECLLGDYGSSLAVLAPVDVCGENEYYHRVFGCYLELYYHLGFAFLMVRRYKDCITVLGTMVSTISRLDKSGQLNRVSGGEGKRAKTMADRMATLLAIAAALSPGHGAKLGDVVQGMSRESAQKFLDSKSTLEAAVDGSEFESYFEKACPKFISAALPNYDQPTSLVHAPVRRQVDLFSKQCSQQIQLAKIRSFLKLYTAVEIEKLAKFHGSDSVDEFRSELLATKHLMMQTESQLGFSCAEGEVKSALDVHFYVNGAMIHVDDDTTEKEVRHENFFMAEIRKTEAAVKQMRKSMAEQLKVQAPAPTPKRSYDD